MRLGRRVDDSSKSAHFLVMPPSRLHGVSSSRTVAIVQLQCPCCPASTRRSTCCGVLPALRANPLRSPFLSQRQLHVSAIATLPALGVRIARSEMSARLQSPAMQCVQQSGGRSHASFPLMSEGQSAFKVTPSLHPQAASHRSGRCSS